MTGQPIHATTRHAHHAASVAVIHARYVEIIEALGRFGYLTPQQILGLKLYADKASLYAALRALVGQRLVIGTDPVSKPGQGRFPSVYALTKAGAELAGLAIDDVIPLRGARPGLPPLDIEHRTAIVDVHLALVAWVDQAGHKLVRYVPDFAASGMRGRRATAIGTPHGLYTPDALAELACVDGVTRHLVIEVYRGGLTGRPGYARRKLPEVLRHVRSAELVKAIGADRPNVSAPRLLVVMETAALRDAILKAPPEPGLEGWRSTFLKALDELPADFAGDWWRIDGKREPLF